MKKFLACTLSIFLMASLAACGNPDSPQVEVESTSEPEASVSEPEVEVSEPEPDPVLPVSADALGDDLYSFQIQLNGVIYTLPAPYSEFAANGWSGKDYDTATLKPDNMSYSSNAYNGDQIVSLSLVNLTGDVLAYEDCDVGKVSLDSFNAQKGATLVLPAGITLGSTMEDVIAAYGEPTSLYEGETLKTLTYTQTTYATVKIQVDAETETVTGIDVENIERTSGGTSTASNAADLPEVVAQYQTPTDFGDGWNSFVVKYAGDFYHIPAPVNTFLENGWKLLDDDVTIPAQSTKVGVSLQKDNQTLRTNVHNYSDIQQPATNCFVTTVRFDQNQSVLPIELAGGITEASSIDDVIAAYGEPADTDESSTFLHYMYGTQWEQIAISVNKDTNKISKIEVTNSPKSLD